MQLLMEENLDAFNELYRRYNQSIYTYFIKNISLNIAEELHQETFYKLIKNKHSFKYESKFKTWLWTIARNTLIDYYRSKDHHMHQTNTLLENEAGEEIYSSKEDSLEEIILKKTNKEQLNACLNELKAEQKEIVMLIIQSELSHEEIAEMTGLKVATIKTHFFRAKDKLIECFKRGGHL